MKTKIPLIAILIYCFSLNAQTFKHKNLEKYFDKYQVSGCFVLYNQNADTYISYNSELCKKAYIPASTFKIPNAVIALEEKILEHENQIMKWDSTIYPVKAWNQDQNLKTAMKYSCVWFFKEIAGQVGQEKYQMYLNRFQYGNKDITGRANMFWLAGELRISAYEQVEFLKSFYNCSLGVSNRSIDITKKTILMDSAKNHMFYGKTGSGLMPCGRNILWMVGFVEKKGNVYFYAMNFECDEIDENKRNARLEIPTNILGKLGVL